MSDIASSLMPSVEQRIQLKAYEIWLSEGQPEGRDQRHWEMAREAVGVDDVRLAELDPTPAGTEETGAPSPTARAPRKPRAM